MSHLRDDIFDRSESRVQGCGKRLCSTSYRFRVSPSFCENWRGESQASESDLRGRVDEFCIGKAGGPDVFDGNIIDILWSKVLGYVRQAL